MLSATPSLKSPPLAESMAGSVDFLDAGLPVDRKKWLDVWAGWPGREIMAHPDYVRLFARAEDRVIGACLRTATGGILYPVILRPLAAEPWAPAGTQAHDLTTAYGYGGPFAWAVTPADALTFWTQFDAWALAQGTVSSFARLSLFAGHLLPFNGETVAIGPNILRRVDLTDGELWSDYRSEARKNIELARQRGVSFELDSSGKRLDEFLSIYTATMNRRGASKRYYFPRSFFESFIQNLTGHFTFAHALVRQRVVSSEIILLSAGHAYSYLGGTLAEAFQFSPNYLIKHETFLWCRDQGKKAVVLGGGYQPNDGILRYKQHFGRNAEVPFLQGRRTYDVDLSRRLVQRRREWEREQGREWTPSTHYYPEYRS
jgi:hypothetical protein